MSTATAPMVTMRRAMERDMARAPERVLPDMAKITTLLDMELEREQALALALAQVPADTAARCRTSAVPHRALLGHPKMPYPSV